jgi:hypothetical protein
MDPQGQVAAVGIAWYLQQDYPAILRIMADADLMPASFEKWQHLAHRIERDLRAQGRIVTRAVIDPATFPEWCRSRDLQVDAKARIAFANQYACRHGRH